jgi:murein DD-endopeptidase MepM/ murein hydrolase activator NlpD
VPPPFLFPPLERCVVTSEYGQRGPVRLPNGTTKPAGFHPGIDLRAAVGTPCLAVGDGVIESVEQGAAGLVLRLRLTTGERASYIHLSAVRAGLRTAVRGGTVIALSGESGGVDPHLHFEVRAAGASGGTNPRPYLAPFLGGSSPPPTTPPPSTPPPPAQGGGGLLAGGVAAAVLWGLFE